MIYTDPERRHEFVILIEAVNSNPNGDPDAGNLPRVDPETMHGFMTDVALKRKVRDYVETLRRNEEGFKIFIQSRHALNTLIEEAGEARGAQKGGSARKVVNEDVREELCRRYYDIRMFGAVLSTGDLNAGQVRGPVQISFARSIDPVVPLDIAITRKARTREEDLTATGSTEMGRKPIVPYGLYRAHGYYNPFLAEQTGVTQEDLQLFWEALANMFEYDRSAARTGMNVRGLWVFTHENRKGNAHAHRLFDLIAVRRTDGTAVPRRFEDYQVVVNREGLPEGVHLTALVEP